MNWVFNGTSLTIHQFFLASNITWPKIHINFILFIFDRNFCGSFRQDISFKSIWYQYVKTGSSMDTFWSLIHTYYYHIDHYMACILAKKWPISWLMLQQSEFIYIGAPRPRCRHTGSEVLLFQTSSHEDQDIFTEIVFTKHFIWIHE